MSKVVKMSSLEFNKDLFKPLQTRSKIDGIFSAEGGIMPGTNSVVTGDPGVGKSTVLLDVLANLQTKGHKVLFVSGEMNAIDMYGYVRRYPKFANLDILFIGDHIDNDPQGVVEDTLLEGYDVVLLDSWNEITEVAIDGHKGHMSKKKADSWMLNLLEQHNKAENILEKHTAFLLIQQVTKSGAFAGSNRIKHMTTAMFHLRYDKFGGRYMHFSKNRRGGRGDKFYFSLDVHNKVDWIRTEPFISLEEEA